MSTVMDMDVESAKFVNVYVEMKDDVIGAKGRSMSDSKGSIASRVTTSPPGEADLETVNVNSTPHRLSMLHR